MYGVQSVAICMYGVERYSQLQYVCTVYEGTVSCNMYVRCIKVQSVAICMYGV
jgi:hypothetical protein